MSYEDQVKNLSEAIDIAIETFKNDPPTGFTPSHVDHFVNTYKDFKHKVLNPESKFANEKSLKYIQDDVLTFFLESNGPTTDAFWKKLNEHGLPYKRKNKLATILKRGEIKNKREYGLIQDLIVPYQQEGLLSLDEVNTLSRLMACFEFIKRKNSPSPGD